MLFLFVLHADARMSVGRRTETLGVVISIQFLLVILGNKGAYRRDLLTQNRKTVQHPVGPLGIRVTAAVDRCRCI